MEELAQVAVRDHSVVYAPRIQDLLVREEKVFRIDATTVGVSDFHLMALYARTGFWHRSWGVDAECHLDVRLRGDGFECGGVRLAACQSGVTLRPSSQVG
ncbi:hypothetical protein [Streptomyces sasae]|uniref:hypothetical protein n=1 Tax=Streptomyces sasae TaxID=1266772 RepID=UPI0029316153|nr:hypothetical protein [Streptomyces sasae]